MAKQNKEQARQVAFERMLREEPNRRFEILLKRACDSRTLYHAVLPDRELIWSSEAYALNAVAKFEGNITIEPISIASWASKSEPTLVEVWPTSEAEGLLLARQDVWHQLDLYLSENFSERLGTCPSFKVDEYDRCALRLAGDNKSRKGGSKPP